MTAPGARRWQRLRAWLAAPAGAAPERLAVGGDMAAAGASWRVLMVCTGNICRSPMAEGVLRRKLQQAGLADRVHVESAGTHGYHTAEAPDPRAVRVAAARGYDIVGLQARPVTVDDFARFDVIYALDDGHLAWLQRQPAAAGAHARLQPLMALARRHPGVTEVADPYYGPEAGFEQVLVWLEDACDGVVDELLQAQRRAPGNA